MAHPGRSPNVQAQKLRVAVAAMHGERPFFLMPVLGRDRFEVGGVITLSRLPCHHP
jgi:hypothetical protein